MKKRIPRKKIITEARTWIGTPYVHQAMVKHHGVDCAMLIAAIATSLDLCPVKNIPVYTKEWHLHNREETLKQILIDNNFDEVPVKDAKPGDVLGFKYGRVISHLGLLSYDNKLIQSSSETMIVTEAVYDHMLPYLKTAFKFPS